MRSVFYVLLFVLISASARRGSGGGRSGGSHSGRSGGTHSYPSSNGYSGTGHSGGNSGTGYSGTKNTHTYPSSTGLSGNNVAGSNVHNTHHQSTYHKTEVHNHYHYNPPQQISYGSQHFPVYHSPPPVYVYQYRDSGSRFDTLLTGLALYNLGRMSNSHHYSPNREYRSNPNERCILGIRKQNGDYEETRIECKLMSSFIWEAQSQPTQQQQQVVQNNVITTVVNDGNKTVSTTVQNTQVVDALQVKGPSIKVTPGMYCFMKRTEYGSVVLQKEIDCGVLQAYAQNSMQYSNSVYNQPSLFLLLLLILYHVM
ncbi:hypothetical protein K1T71_009851 [Dendrolimus kikuchii]|uniref:Uncharacterized protein n=1 Tax=Dendrolimus kikuchii TaxID=765133 RepID=A0ACC1CSV7_9NEOP|nr:hypothetical protein K1T71_009851 [Dendrolimus kikuchii]